MGRVVAGAALWKLGHDTGRMGFGMTFLAIGNRPVFCFMALDAGNRLMFGKAGRQFRESGLVTCAAVLVWNRGAVCQKHGPVRLMTFLAIGLRHGSGMGLMALDAIRDFPMDIMTGGTE